MSNENIILRLNGSIPDFPPDLSWILRGIFPDGRFYGELILRGVDNPMVVWTTGQFSDSINVELQRLVSQIEALNLDTKVDACDGLLGRGPYDSQGRIFFRYAPQQHPGTEAEVLFRQIIALITPTLQNFLAREGAGEKSSFYHTFVDPPPLCDFCADPKNNVTSVSLLSWLADRLNKKTDLAERKLLFEVGLTGTLGRYPTLAITFLDKDPSDEELNQIEEEIATRTTVLLKQKSVLDFTEFLSRETPDWNLITAELFSRDQDT